MRKLLMLVVLAAVGCGGMVPSGTPADASVPDVAAKTPAIGSYFLGLQVGAPPWKFIAIVADGDMILLPLDIRLDTQVPHDANAPMTNPMNFPVINLSGAATYDGMPIVLDSVTMSMSTITDLLFCGTAKASIAGVVHEGTFAAQLIPPRSPLPSPMLACP